MALVLDTGVLVAALMRDDRHHDRCRQLLESTEEMRLIPAPVLPEVDYWVSRQRGSRAMAALLSDVTEGSYLVEDLTGEDYRRAADLLETYIDLDVGFVDAAILAVVERLGETKLATLDHRHFTAMRPRHVEALELLPA